jgi:hypothetical protein
MHFLPFSTLIFSYKDRQYATPRVALIARRAQRDESSDVMESNFSCVWPLIVVSDGIVQDGRPNGLETISTRIHA